MSFRTPTRVRAVLRIAVAGLAVVAATWLVAPGPAQAATEYRYWGYWYVEPGASTWTYGQIGPASHAVTDGSVEGWRFAVSVPTPSGAQPRARATSFSAICGKTERPPGKDRVAVVVDYGTTSDAPPGQRPPSGVRGTCAVVNSGSKGLTALAEAGYGPRLSSGLVCGLSGYPTGECGVVVQSQPSPSASRTKTPAKTAPRSSSPGSSKNTAKPLPTSSAEAATADEKDQPAAGSPAPDSTSSDGSGPSASVGAAQPVPTTDASSPLLAVGPPPQPPGGSGGGPPIGAVLGLIAVAAVGSAAVLRGRRAGRASAA